MKRLEFKNNQGAEHYLANTGIKFVEWVRSTDSRSFHLPSKVFVTKRKGAGFKTTLVR